MFLFSLCLCAFFSLYYTAFSIVLSPLVLFAFIWKERIRFVDSLKSLRRISVALFLYSFIGLAVLAPIMRHAVIGTDGEKSGQHSRDPAELYKHSARFQDFFLPTESSALYNSYLTLSLAMTPERIGHRIEVTSYFGFSVSLLLVMTLIHWLVLGKKRLLCKREMSVWFILFLTALILSTPWGGSLPHLLLRGIRCYNRLAPIALLFCMAFVIIYWKNFIKLRSWMVMAFLCASILELSGHKLYSKQSKFVVPETFDLFTDQLAQVCPDSIVRVEPAVDYIFGPYYVLYAAERDKCQLHNVGGSGRRSFEQLGKKQKPAFVAAMIQFDRDQPLSSTMQLVPYKESF